MKKPDIPDRYPPNKEEGVSPVVGVMLMLVVTIIIAAVVSSFASGMGTSSQAAPTASLGIVIASNAGDSAKNVTINHLGGETLDTKDLQIITTYTVPAYVMKIPITNAGKVIKHTMDGSLPPTSESDINTDTGVGYPWAPQTTNNADIVSKRTADATFGTAKLVAGSSIQFERSYFLGFDTEADNAVTAYGFAGDSTVHVTIVHVPSGKTIYDNDVVISW